MANRALGANVHVPSTGTLPAKYFAAGSSPEKEYAEQITNDKAWDDSGGPQSSQGSAQSEASSSRATARGNAAK